MAYLFDTDAISETLRKRPLADYIDWLNSVSKEEQYTSTIVIAELYKGAFRSQKSEIILEKINRVILPQLTVIPFDVVTAKIYGEIYAELEKNGQILAHADLQIAATAIQHNLTLVTGNIKHFNRIGQLKINFTLADAKKNN
ncbi:MAG: type II toxin-antitoxin system VapC family toxin [Crocosphaera sp.]